VRVVLQVHTLIGHSKGVSSVDFSPNGKRVVSASGDNLVKLWDVETGVEVSNFVVQLGWRDFVFVRRRLANGFESGLR
jgi:WD40 repeat protein